MTQRQSDECMNSGRRGWLKNGNSPGDPNSAPRCGAKTRRGTRCQAPRRVTEGVECMVARVPALAPPDGLARSRRARWKHGGYSVEEMTEQKRAHDLIR